MAKRIRQDPAYLREQGKKELKEKNKRNITFCFSKHIKGEGQSFEEWEEEGLLSQLFERLKQLGNYPVLVIKQNDWITEYHKVDFPPKSDFKVPQHISGVTWATIHIKPNSKAVIVGYIENDIFYVVFLDKDHRFWITEKKNT
ncbi:hypothetical protein ACLB9Y_00915 [Chryseobacterium scophthalmum]|uniref:hypothetical protein n=1 Tax=Chryseobacterium scophthalmum TaxID=59733 RepID=UPI00398B82B7